MHARRSSSVKGFLSTLALSSVAFFFFGCDTAQFPLPTDASRTRPDTSSFPPVQSLVSEDSDDNSTFENAQPATLPVDGEFTIEGRIDAKADIDIYALGPAVAGDRVVAEVTGVDGLNTVAALFDGDRDLIDANDDRSYYASQFDPYIALVIRRNTDNLYIGVAVTTATHFSSQAGRFDVGSYRIKLSRKPGYSVSPARQQVVWLDFEGGDDVQIAVQPVERMRAFSAESISNRMAGQTVNIANQVVQRMRQDYAAYNVLFYSSKEGSEPAGPKTRIFFGNFNASFLGLSDNVDTGNATLEQEAIVYSEDLALYEGLLPTADEIAQALANIGSHELGHLLGLEHSADATDIMATAASARQILETDCAILRTRLETRVFPAGWQNGRVLVGINVGYSPGHSARLIEDERQGLNPDNDWRNSYDLPVIQCGDHLHAD